MKHLAALGFVVPRLVFTLFCLITSLYCLIAYVPFTYQQVIEFQVVSWTSVFARWHPWIYWVAFACGAWTLANDFRRGTRALVLTYLVAGAGFGAWLVASPLLVNLRNDQASLFWAGVWLLPVGWLALVDLAGPGRRLVWGGSDAAEDARLFRACVATGIALAVVYMAIQPLRARGILIERASAGVLVWSVLLHTMVFLALFVVFASVRGISSVFRRPALVEFTLATIGSAVVATLVIQKLIFASISLVGPTGEALALGFGVALAMTGAGWAARLADPGRPVLSGIELAMTPLDPLAGTPRAVRILGVIVWAGIAYWLAVLTAVMDWNYLFQKLGALTVWALGFTWIYQAFRRGREPRAAVTVAILLAPAIAVLGFRTLSSTPPLLEWLNLPASTRAATIDRYAAFDVSFRLAHDFTGSGEARPGVDMSRFYDLLQAHTNIPRTVAIHPPDARLVPAITPITGRKPHIFFIVIDSLRPDYLSPYNAKVTFTPGIDALAKDSVVFRHAFTHYGATGLSEPSLWTGTMVPHQQYPDEMWRMNALQQVLQAGQYRAFVSKDHILQRLLGPWPELTELDRGRGAADYDVCRTLDELDERVRSRDPADPAPMFAYTQPQNVHISTITRQGATVPAGESYPGFYAPYASRLHRVDACIATFVGALRRANLYDDSLIILTSDHGESIGEDGRWGHAYTLYPEVVRIPLIVHVPVWLRQLAVDPDRVSFAMDMTPSIYYLLGQRPTANGPLDGRPLFTQRPDEAQPYLRSEYVVASSYGPVYAAISGDGRSLYIADATAYQEYAFDLDGNAGGTRRPVTEAMRTAGMKAIRSMIQEVAKASRIAIDNQ